MKFRSFYLEGVTYPKSEDFIKVSEEAIKLIQKIGFTDIDIFWRGFKKKKIASPVIQVSGERETFYGGHLGGQTAKMIDLLGVKFPAFTSRSGWGSGFFGTSMIFVPMKPFKAWQSPKVDDLLVDLKNKTDDELKEILKTYTDTLKRVSDGEIIFDAKKYLLIDPNQMLFTMRQNNDIKSLKKYKDIVKLLMDYIAYIKGLKK